VPFSHIARPPKRRPGTPNAARWENPTDTNDPRAYAGLVDALRAVVAEDHALVREGIVSILERGVIQVVDAWSTPSGCGNLCSIYVPTLS
jgi:hypothetical protein